jgi:hypothetical protein
VDSLKVLVEDVAAVNAEGGAEVRATQTDADAISRKCSDTGASAHTHCGLRPMYTVTLSFIF